MDEQSGETEEEEVIVVGESEPWLSYNHGRNHRRK